MARARTLAQVYRHFGEVDAAGTSPLYERVAVALSESDEALRAIEAAPARKRHPAVILAALHDLALAGRAPAAGRGLCRGGRRRRRQRGDRHAAAHDRHGRGHRRAPAVPGRRDRPLRRALSGHRRGGRPGRRRLGRAHRRGLFGRAESQCRSRGPARTATGRCSATRLPACRCRASVVGERTMPARAMPEVVARIGFDLDPVDVTDADEARWLRASSGPDQPRNGSRGSTRRRPWRRPHRRNCCAR